MIKIEIQGVKEVIRSLEELRAQRIPNYLARGVNDVLRQVQAEMIGEVQSNLTVRGSWIRPGTRFGINARFATKDRLFGTVSCRAPWLVAQEEDEVKRPEQGSHLLVPLAALRASRTDPRKIPRRMLPSALGSKLFKRMTPNGPVLFRYLKRQGLQPLYALESSVKFPRRIHLMEHAERAINEDGMRIMLEQVDQAIKEQGLK